MNAQKTIFRIILGCLFTTLLVVTFLACNYQENTIEARNELTKSDLSFSGSDIITIRDAQKKYFLTVKIESNDSELISNYKKSLPYLKVEEYESDTKKINIQEPLEATNNVQKDENIEFQFIVIDSNIPKGIGVSIEFKNTEKELSNYRIMGSCVNPETVIRSGNYINDFATGVRIRHNSSTGCEAIVAYHSKAWYGWNHQYSKTIYDGQVDAFFASNYTTNKGVNVRVTYNKASGNPIKVSTWYF